MAKIYLSYRIVRESVELLLISDKNTCTPY